MTDKNLQKIFNQFGVKKFGAVGDVFDPTMHDALFQIPSTNTGNIINIQCFWVVSLLCIIYLFYIFINFNASINNR